MYIGISSCFSAFTTSGCAERLVAGSCDGLDGTADGVDTGIGMCRLGMETANAERISECWR